MDRVEIELIDWPSGMAECAYCGTWIDGPKCGQCGANDGEYGRPRIIWFHPPANNAGKKSRLTKWWERVVLNTYA